MLFGPRKVQVEVELSEDTKHLLSMLDGDLQALQGMVSDLLATHAHVIEMVKGEISVVVADAAGIPVNGIQVFEEEQVALPTLVAGDKVIPPPPGSMGQRDFEETMDQDDPNRSRNTPFTRAPRSAQVEWLRNEVMQDGGWYAAILIARNVANDERHYRYLKGAISGRLREMHEDGLVLRRDSHVKGSMYEYRLKEASDDA